MRSKTAVAAERATADGPSRTRASAPVATSSRPIASGMVRVATSRHAAIRRSANIVVENRKDIGHSSRAVTRYCCGFIHSDRTGDRSEHRVQRADELVECKPQGGDERAGDDAVFQGGDASA